MGSGKDRVKIQDRIADGMCSQASLDFHPGGSEGAGISRRRYPERGVRVGTDGARKKRKEDAWTRREERR